MCLNRRMLALAVGIMAILAGGVPSFGQQNDPFVGEYTAFDEIFSIEDTITLDPSILIGEIQSLDVSDSGSLVMVDGVAQSIYLFDATGSHVAELSNHGCFPDPSFMPFYARFVDKGWIVARDWDATILLFDSTGKCTAGKRQVELLRTTGFCEFDGSIIALRSFTPEDPALVVLNLEFDVLREQPLSAPGFPMLNAQVLPLPGRSIGCFKSGLWFIYPESPDAMSAESPDRSYSVPEFYKDRTGDLSQDRQVNLTKRMGRIMGATLAVGLYELYESVHVVEYFGSRKGRFNEQKGIGLQIVDHANPESAVSTIADINIKAAKDGFLYVVGDHEALPDGTVANPLIVRYRYRR